VKFVLSAMLVLVLVVLSPFLGAQSTPPQATQATNPTALVPSGVDPKQPVLTDAQKLKMVELLTAAKEKNDAAAPERLGKDIGLFIAERQTARDEALKAVNDQYGMLMVPGWTLDIRSADSRTWMYTPVKK